MIAAPIASIRGAFLDSMMFRNLLADLAKDTIGVNLVPDKLKASFVIGKLFVETRDIVPL